MSVRKHLYFQVYLTFVGITVLCIVVGATVFALTRDDMEAKLPVMRATTERVLVSLPEEPEARAAWLTEYANEMDMQLTLWAEDGRVLAASHSPMTFVTEERIGWIREDGGPGVRYKLNDGRWMGVLVEHDHAPHRVADHVLALLGLALVAALGCYPLARRITRRLESLRSSVQRFGEGSLSERVEPKGKDEVADLARSFNRAAERIESLVDQHRRVVANASHELRTPLTRMRMAMELLADTDDPTRRKELLVDAEADVDALDQLIEDVLLSSRLEAGADPAPREVIDLAAYVRDAAEENGWESHTPEGPARVFVNQRQLDRLFVNLTENARTHGGGVRDVRVTTADGRAQLLVADNGPGIPPERRTQVFEAFHKGTESKGAGLGLALVAQIAASHRATCEVRDAEGGGALIEVAFPLVARENDVV